jgi:hypothetical protein
MNKAQKLHNYAMALADLALKAKVEEKKSDMQLLFKVASYLEKQAADLTKVEPSNTILNKSASELAKSAKTEKPEKSALLMQNNIVFNREHPNILIVDGELFELRTVKNNKNAEATDVYFLIENFLYVSKYNRGLHVIESLGTVNNYCEFTLVRCPNVSLVELNTDRLNDIAQCIRSTPRYIIPTTASN